MKKIIFILFASAVFVSCGDSPKETVVKNMNAVEFVDSVKALKDQIQIVDVRTPNEFSKGTLAPEVKNIDFNAADFKEKIEGLDKQKPVYVFCLSGDRSNRSIQAFKDAGFAYVVAMQGGLLALNKAGNQPAPETNQPVTEKTVTVAQYEEYIAKNKNVIVDFYADWCGPCKRMAPVLEELQTANKDKFTILKVDIDHSKDLARQFKVSSIPRLFVYKDGKQVDDVLGFNAADPEGFKAKLLSSFN